MTDNLSAEFPEAAVYIHQAIKEHGEEWVLDNYYEKIYPLGVVMAIPEKEDLPFYEAEHHDTLTEEEKREMYEGWAVHRENLRSASENGRK